LFSLFFKTQTNAKVEHIEEYNEYAKCNEKYDGYDSTRCFNGIGNGVFLFLDFSIYEILEKIYMGVINSFTDLKIMNPSYPTTKPRLFLKNKFFLFFIDEK
jgi:hypothetical protein